MKTCLVFFIISLLISNSSFSQIQSNNLHQPKLFSIELGGSFGIPVGYTDFQSESLVFPGIKMESCYNLNSHLAIIGSVNMDFIPTSVPDYRSPVEEDNLVFHKNTQLSFSAGTRIFFNNDLSKERFYFDTGAGLYLFKHGYEDVSFGSDQVGTYSYSLVPQFGFNAGFGINESISEKIFINIDIEYYNVFKRVNAERTRTSQSSFTGNSEEIVQTITQPQRNYIQFDIGLGYYF